MGLAYNPKIVTNGLVGFWDAANPKSYPGSGSRWFDLSGNGYHATAVNVTVDSNRGTPGWNFNEDESKYIQTDSTISIGATWTYEFVAYINGDTRTIPFTTSTHNAATRAAVNLDLNGTSHIYAGSNYTTWPTFSTAQTIANYTFVYLQVTNNNGTFNVWFSSPQEGPLVRKITNATPGPVNQFSTERLYWGRYAGGNSYALNGHIFSTKWYNRALTETEIQQNFNATRGRYGL